MKIHLGVLDVPHGGDAISTGDLAEILEDHYGVMAGFVELHDTEIANDLGDALAGHLENFMAGAPASSNPLASAMGEIEVRFHRYIDSEEIVKVGAKDPRFPVPTGGALTGKSGRFKKGKNASGRRVSLVDTGIYENSFRAWTEE